MGIGLREVVIVLVIVLILFGSRKLPDIMRDLAKGIHSFKDGLKGDNAAPAADKTDSSKDDTKPNA
jgi:sec-independent protein translocase protein TatA